MIAAAEAFLIRLPYRIGTEPKSDQPRKTLDHVLLRLETREGLVGWGEAFGYRAAAATLAALREIVIPLAKELPDLDPVSANAQLQRACHQGGRAGPLLYAIAAIDIALWDISAQRQGRPLQALLGTASRKTLPAYASLLRYGDPHAVADRCRDALGAGFTAIKLHEIDPNAMRAARDTIGPEVPLMVDANCAWAPDEAIRIAASLRDLNLHWLEEPVFPPEDFAALARVMRETGMKLAAGENSATPAEFQAMIDRQAVTYLQPSVTKIGGLTPMRMILDLADARGWKVAPHSPYFGPGLLATLHLLASRDDDTLAEYYHPVELAGCPYSDALVPIDGAIAIPDGAGLGLEPTAEAIRAFAV